MQGYPKQFLPTLWWIFPAVAATGLVLIPGALELRFDTDIAWHLPEGARIYVAMGHALFAFGALALIGALIPLHMRFNLRRRHNITTGITLATVASLVALTSLGIYYFADETLSR